MRNQIQIKKFGISSWKVETNLNDCKSCYMPLSCLLPTTDIIYENWWKQNACPGCCDITSLNRSSGANYSPLTMVHQ